MENSAVSQHIITLAQALARRNRRYHRTPGLRLRTAADIQQFVDEVGLCLLFPVQGIESPNVYQAVAGFDKATTAKHDDATISLTWNTKDQALSKRWWYYGKLIKSKATLVSLDLLPSFYALSANYGEPDDYLQEYAAGTLTAEAKNIYEALLNNGPMHTIELKRKAGLYGDSLKGKFDKALTELQVALKVMPTGVTEAGAWRYAFIYDITSRWLPAETARAQTLSRGDARAAILARHLRNVVFATPKELTRIFGWTARETASTIQQLVAGGQAALGVVVKGVEGEVVAHIEA